MDKNTMMGKFQINALLGAALLVTAYPAAADSLEVPAGSNKVEIWITRHAEKETVVERMGGEDSDSKILEEVCNEIECAEQLSAKGKQRAELLADWFADRGITDRVTHVFSSHKMRTRQTVELIAEDAGLIGTDDDLISDGVQQLPTNLTELQGKASVSEDVTAETLLGLAPGSVAVVGAHSGTIYDILDKMGADTFDPEVFPRRADNGKVPTFGDLWRVVIRTRNNGEKIVRVQKRIQLQPVQLKRTEIERPDDFAPTEELH